MNQSNADLPGVDLHRLRQYLASARPELATSELRGELIAGGRSNLTYVIGNAEREWILRRPPLGHVLATAHDMAREYRVITALAPTSVPVPETMLLCTDEDVLGAPFYLMHRVHGVVMRTRRELAALRAEQVSSVCAELVDVLVALHRVDPVSVGLRDFGRPEGFLARQVRRWGKQLDASRSRDLPGIDELRTLLADTVPTTQRVAVLHGDYRLDNVLLDLDPLRITAVLDWEMATLGDPLTDLGLFVVYCRRGTSADDPITGGATTVPGFAPVRELVDRYAERAGVDVSRLDWYVGLACFKLAVILEGIHYRFTQGKTVGAGFDTIGAMVPPLVTGGLAALRTGDPYAGGAA